jgi:transcriptional regulator GlxA family with amidase domain
MRNDPHCYPHGLPPALDTARMHTQLAHALEANGGSDPVLLELALALASLSADTRAETAITFRHLVDAIQLHLGGSLAQPAAPQHVSTECLATWQVRRATELMQVRLGEKICLPEVARACGLSTSYFSRLFKNTLGMTTHQWLMVQRVERAKVLLSTTCMPIVDQTHMTRVFSKRVRSSPLVWRRLTMCGVRESGSSRPACVPRGPAQRRERV